MNYLFTHSNSSYSICGTNPNQLFLVDTIINDVAIAMDAPVFLIKGECRKARIKNARWMIWKILYSRGYKKKEIADMFARDNATVLHALCEIDVMIAKDKTLQKAWQSVSHHFNVEQTEPKECNDPVDRLRIKDLKVFIRDGIKCIMPI